MGCGSKTIKFLLFAFNLIFALGGLAILIIGAIIQWNIAFYDEFFGSSIAVPSIILIVAGSIVFIISFLGCCGALRESVCMLNLFAIIMSLLFVLQMTGGILAFVFTDSLDSVLRETMQESMTHYKGEGTENQAVKQSWDALQSEYYCCGVDSFLDWTTIAGMAPPSSCECKNTAVSCTANVYSKGCYDAMANLITTIQYAMAGVAVAVAAVELVGVIFACCLATSIKKQRKHRSV